MDFYLLNQGTANGSGASDRLFYTYNYDGGGVWTQAFAGSLATGYSGWYDGTGSYNAYFSGIGHFNLNTYGFGNDVLTTGDGDDTVNSYEGNDVITTGAGIDVVDGGAGSDRWGADKSFATSAITIDINGASSYLGTGSVVNVESLDLKTGSGNDRITGHAAVWMSDTVDTGGGNDTITMQQLGPDSIIGGAGHDLLELTYSYDNGAVYSQAFEADPAGGYRGWFDGTGDGNTYFSGIERFHFTSTTLGYDSIVSGDGDDTMDTGGGNDTVYTGAGVDDIDGGAGLDRWGADKSFTSTAISINLNNPVSTYLTTGTVTNIESLDLKTGSGGDLITLHATSGMSDTVDTGAGNDSVRLTMGGVDSVIGGAGFDTLVVTYDYDNSGVVTNAFTGTLATGYSGWLDGVGLNNAYYDGIERFSFTSTTLGYDWIQTGDGNDTMSTGGGNDTMTTAKGVDIIDGGDGFDRWAADKSFTSTAITIDINGASTYLGTGTVQNVESLNLMTGSGADAITLHTTSRMDDTVNGGGGNDTVTLTMGGIDSITGGTGHDLLHATYDYDNTGVVTSAFTGDTTTGYSGWYDGVGLYNSHYTGIERFFFESTKDGYDSIRTGDFNDTVLSGNGNDTANTGQGIDVVDGGAGFDRWIADKSFTSTAITVDINGASTYLGTGTVQNVESLNLMTGSGADAITLHTTSRMDDTVDGGGGNDTVTLTMGGIDSITGGTGHDLLHTTYDYDNTGVFTTDFAGDTATGYSGWYDGVGLYNSHYTGIERFFFESKTDGYDNIRTGDFNDTVLSGNGHDNVNTGQGIDVVDGGTGLDRWTADKSFTATAITIDLNTASSYLGTGSVVNFESMALATGSGDDAITGHASAWMSDTVDAGAGNDTITMQQRGPDSIIGGEGNDLLALTWSYDNGGVVSNAFEADPAGGYRGWFDGTGDGNTHFAGIERFSFTSTTLGYDFITTGDGNDSFATGGGDDTVYAGGGIDVIDGGDGLDRFGGNKSFATDAVVIDLNATVSVYLGTGQVSNVESFDLVTGSGHDSLTGHLTAQMNDTLVTGAGNDTVTLQQFGADSVDGGTGDDLLVLTWSYDNGGVVMNAFAGDVATGYSGWLDGTGSFNTYFAGIERFTFTSTTLGYDWLRFGDGFDTASTGGGNDTVYGYGGNDLLNGGAGTDYLDGGEGDDTVDYSGSGGPVTVLLGALTAGHTTTTVAALEGTDTLIDVENIIGTAFGDVLTGNDLENTFAGGLGNDTINGGGTIDTVDFSRAAAGIAVDLGRTSLQNTLSQGLDLITNVENAMGSAHGDVITGSGVDNYLFGQGGNDTLNGAAGNDYLFGGDGNDTFRSNVGFDLFDGGAGIDTVVFSTASSIRVFLDGTGTNAAAAAGDMFSGIENIAGAVSNDIIVGDGQANRLSGFTGNDTLWGRAGNDQLEGQDGHDRLYGGTGNDILVGGAGNDVFVFADAPAAGGLDRTTDFSVADDQIEIDASAFGGGLVAGGAVQFVSGAAPSAAGFVGGVFLYNTSNGFLSFDADGGGAGAAVAFFRLQNLPVGLSAADFTVVA